MLRGEKITDRDIRENSGCKVEEQRKFHSFFHFGELEQSFSPTALRLKIQKKVTILLLENRIPHICGRSVRRWLDGGALISTPQA